MADRSKRKVSTGLSSAHQRRRTDQDHEGHVMRAVTAIRVMVGTVAQGAAQQSAPNVRVLNDLQRLSWDKHLDDLRHGEFFTRFYRMEERSFDKLDKLLRPRLRRNEHYGCESFA